MNANRTLAASAVASFLGLVLAAPSGAADEAPAPAKRAPHEKCYGIAKRGQNDCSTATHSCSNESTSDGDAGEWLWLPKGTCAKIVGGVVNTATK